MPLVAPKWCATSSILVAAKPFSLKHSAAALRILSRESMLLLRPPVRFDGAGETILAGSPMVTFEFYPIAVFPTGNILPSMLST